MMRIGNAKARHINYIRCAITRKRREKCTRQKPLGPKITKYRGRHKCWGCHHATWANTGKAYGPWPPKEWKQK